MIDLSLLLIAPEYGNKFCNSEFYTAIKKAISTEQPDLIVFPEACFWVNSIKEMEESFTNIFKIFSIPALTGFSLSELKEENWAILYNANPQKGDSKLKRYCKHSTSERLAYELPNYKERKEEFFAPFILNGNKIQFNICHDIFFSLITEALEIKGMDILINITGGDVNRSKWHNIFRGRSLEKNIPVFCTMGHNSDKKAYASSFGYFKGDHIIPNSVYGNMNEDGFQASFYDLRKMKTSKVEEDSITYTEKRYSDITFSINLKDKADINIDFDAGEQKISLNKVKIKDKSKWILLHKENSIGVLLADISNIFNRAFMPTLDYPNDASSYIIVYHSFKPVDPSSILALMKLRAIENRVGCAIVSPNLYIAVKTTRYKNIQIVNLNNQIAGLGFNFMGGPESVFDKTGNSGINIKHADDYKSLIIEK